MNGIGIGRFDPGGNAARLARYRTVRQGDNALSFFAERG